MTTASVATAARRPNGRYSIRLGSSEIGEAWRIPNRSRQWGLKVHGVYWRGGGLKEPNTRGGCTATDAATLRDAVKRAGEVHAALLAAK